MFEKYTELKEYLEGLTEEMPEPFFHLAEILKYQALEIHADNNTGNCLIPYMMNDALEYYLILEEARMTGEFQPEEEIVSAQITKKEDRYFLIIRQTSGNICTICFEQITEDARCYQYHRIGHFWVKGQEQWRQLVYMTGTIYDKFEYFGERFCSKKESTIRDLIRFAPFREWSPITDSLKEQYPNAEEGFDTMWNLASEAEDKEYQRLLRLYRRFPYRCVERLLAKQLCSPKRQKLYQVIYQKIEEASAEYPERDYGTERNEEIEKMRSAMHQKLIGQGYEGEYPEYSKGTRRISAAEEHPFTIMEKEDFKFRIRLMVSECEGDKGRNAGFFRKKGRKGWIE